MNVTIYGPNLNDQTKGTFHVHSEGCQHSKHYGPGTKFGGEDNGWTVKVDSKLDVARDVYPPGDFEWDGTLEQSDSYINDFHWAPCTRSLPIDVAPVKPESRRRDKVSTPAPKKDNGNYHGFKFAVAWIALNDEPEELNIGTMSDLISVALAADLFRKTPLQVAQAVVAYRRRHR